MSIYHVRRSLPDDVRDAILNAYFGLAIEAKGQANERGSTWTRELAAKARGLIRVFGVRSDGARRSPFATIHTARVECTMCGRSAIAAGPLARMKLVDALGRTLAVSHYCGRCTDIHRRYPAGHTLVEAAERPEAACAA